MLPLWRTQIPGGWQHHQRGALVRLRCLQVTATPQLQLLSQEQLRELPGPGREINVAGVYFLWRNRDLQYVGVSNECGRRLRHHERSGEIPHDRASLLRVEWPWNLAYEAAYIDAYQPPLNRRGKKYRRDDAGSDHSDDAAITTPAPVRAPANEQKNLRVLRLPAVIAKTGVGRDTIYRWGKAGKFPKPVKLSERSSGWLEHEIERWISTRAQSV